MTTTSAPAVVRIAEYFLSIQGEGPSIGCPAHFVRLQGCSVGCHWCDSKYTWKPDRGDELSLAELESQLAELGSADLLVITGGEPLEHPSFPAVVAWAAARWTRVEVETSGIRPPPLVPENVHWNWSPKLSSVTEHSDGTWAHYRDFVESRQFVCKIVVDDTNDWHEAVSRTTDLDLPPDRVLIMPQGMSADAIHERARWLAPLCIEQGFRLTTRLHVDLWGAKRGV